MTSRTDATSVDNHPIENDLKKIDPILPKATSLLINSGNVVSGDRLKKRTNINPQDELIEVINTTFSNWLNTINKESYQENKVIECRNPETYEKLQESELDDISISVKLFLNSLDPEVVNQSIKQILNEMGADHIDTLIISYPDKVFTHEELPNDLVIPVWSVIQDYIDAKKISTAGLADFNATYLEQFYNLLQDKNRKPSINQVNLTSCCKMPEDLVEFSKINNIQLTTHLDPRELLNSESLQSNLRKNVHEYDSHGWIPLWQARYTLILKGRGIVKSKGYVVYAQRELRYTE
ncbi:unnamed protein product [Brachionus calyciflorus]|uniref:GCS light chain n=1 Tax=Brachionus calyciflorus TaxID=104777 RepID=A0A813PIV9_9BILA|nr:unnamed protein product [Brachionus calyciflorus]